LMPFRHVLIGELALPGLAHSFEAKVMRKYEAILGTETTMLVFHVAFACGYLQGRRPYLILKPSLFFEDLQWLEA
jgi:hypothetical protein